MPVTSKEAKMLAIFVEGPVCYKAGREKNERTDFARMGEELAKFRNADAYEVRYYSAEPSNGFPNGLQGFLEGLARQPNVRMITPRARQIAITCPNCKHNHSYDDLPVHWEMVRDMLQGAYAEAYDDAIVVSGRQDFVPVVQVLDTIEGLDIATAFWGDSRMLSPELRDAVDFIDLSRFNLSPHVRGTMKPRW